MQDPSKILSKSIGPITLTIYPFDDGSDGFRVRVASFEIPLLLKAGERLVISAKGSEVTIATDLQPSEQQ